MVALSLKIGVGNVVKTMQFEPSTMVYDACRIIRERVPEAPLGQREFTHTLLRSLGGQHSHWVGLVKGTFIKGQRQQQLQHQQLRGSKGARTGRSTTSIIKEQNNGHRA